MGEPRFEGVGAGRSDCALDEWMAADQDTGVGAEETHVTHVVIEVSYWQCDVLNPRYFAGKPECSCAGRRVGAPTVAVW